MKSSLANFCCKPSPLFLGPPVRVKELIDGKNYSITDCCGFLRPNETAAWEPVINIMIANEIQLGVRVNLDMQKVTALETFPVATLGPRSNETAVSPDSSQIFP